MRIDWDPYFLQIASVAATRSTCDRLHVGCVLVRNKVVIATGYNGSVRGLDHCDEFGHDIEDDHCQRTVHAESNAIAQAAREGARTSQATAYVTHAPCWPCFKLLVNAGIERIVYGAEYRLDTRVHIACYRLGIQISGLT